MNCLICIFCLHARVRACSCDRWRKWLWQCRTLTWAWRWETKGSSSPSFLTPWQVCVCVCGICLLMSAGVHTCGQSTCSLIGFVPVLMHNAAVNFAEYCALCRAEGGSWSFLSLFLFYFSAPVLLTRPWHHRVVDPEVLHLWRGWVPEKYMSLCVRWDNVVHSVWMWPACCVLLPGYGALPLKQTC